MRHRSFKFVLLSLAIALVSCGTVSALVTTLDAVQAACSAAAVAIPLLDSAGTISPAEAAAAMTFISSAAAATSQAITEAESSDTTVVKGEKIAAIYSQVLSAVPGLPPQVPGLVSAVIDAIHIVLGQLGVAAKYPGLGSAIALSRADRHALDRVRQNVDRVQRAAAVWKPAHRP